MAIFKLKKVVRFKVDDDGDECVFHGNEGNFEVDD